MVSEKEAKRLRKRIKRLELALKIIATWCHFEPKYEMTCYKDIENKCNEALDDE